MPCFNPKPATLRKVYTVWKNRYKYDTDAEGNRFRYFTYEKTPINKWENELSFRKNYTQDVAKEHEVYMIPCGKCNGCRIEQAKEWAVRATMEAKCWKKNCFVTLTYSDDKLPKDEKLHKEDLQKFWKRLRDHECGIEEWEINGIKEKPIRYLSCGEYGEHSNRPHYHAIIYNYMPDDLKEYKANKHGDMTYTSAKLEKIWGHGFITVGMATYETANYVAKYLVKNTKSTNNKGWLEASRKIGIGKPYWDKHKEEIIKEEGIYINTAHGVKKTNIPRYLKNKWKLEDEAAYEELRENNHYKHKIEQNEILERTDLTAAKYTTMKANKLQEKIDSKHKLL